MSETVMIELSMTQLMAAARAVAAAERHHEEPWRGLFAEVREVLEGEIERESRRRTLTAAGCACCGEVE